MKFSTYFGTNAPADSPYARSSNLYEAKPTTGEVLGAYVEETFQGEGSLSQDIKANNIQLSEQFGTAYSKPSISEEDWRGSENYREGLQYYPWMNEQSAKILAEVHDDRSNRQLIMEKASKLQTVAGFGVGFLSGVAEPKNLVSGVAAALVTGGVGAAVPTLGRVMAVNTVRGAAVRGAAEGVVGAAVTEPSNIESSRIVQGDYTMADSVMNLALGSVLGAGLGAGGKALELRAEGKANAKAKQIIEAYQAEEKLAVKEFDTALAQMSQGAEIDVTAVKQLDNIEVSTKAKQELPNIEEKLAIRENELGISRIVDTPEFNNWFGKSAILDEQSRPQVVYGNDIVTQGEYGEGVYLKSQPQDISGTAKSLYSKIENPIPELEYQQLKFNQSKAVELGYDGFVSNDKKTVVAFKPEQVKSAFSKPSPELEKLQAKKSIAEANSKTQVDNAPVKKFGDDLARPDNSTAYDPKISDEIQTYLDENQFEDQVALERNIEEMMEQIEELKQQDLLNDAELKILEDLAGIDAESSIFDNVLLSAKLCLTRG